MPKITVNGQQIEAKDGQSVWYAAHLAGVKVPYLCASPNLKAYGSCRLCVCEVDGMRGFPASCTTPVKEGMVVRTESDKLTHFRRNIIELYLSEQPEGEQASEQLREYAAQFGLKKVRYKRKAKRDYALDESNPFFSFDANKCIACARCVRACDEVQGTFAISMEGRGFASSVVAGNSVGFEESNCVSCGACVKECPTGALFEKAVAKAKTKPEYVGRTTCAYCGVGCNFDVGVADGKIVTMKPVDASPVNWGHACVKGRFGWDYIYSKDRLKKPLKKVNGQFVETTWDDALSIIGRELKRIRDTYGATAIAGISSSRGTNEENYLMQKFIRCAVGSNNVDNCARVCHSATVSGMMEVFGTWAATNSLNDFEKAKLLMLVGANPTEGHPVTGARIKRAVRRGMKLIVIDPRRIELCRYAAVHLQLKPGTNVALFNGLANVILSEGLYDKDFIAARTENFDAWAETVKKYTPEETERITGVPAEKIRIAARLYATSGASMAAHGLGMTEHKYGSYGIMTLCNMAILTGNVGRPGTGINPLRGQNNVQGSCDVGSMPVYFSSYQKLNDPAVRHKFEVETGRPLPEKLGWKIPEMWDASLGGELKALWLMGYDVAQTDPNLNKVHAALGKLEFLAVTDLFFNETCKFAHVVLPAASFVEKDGTFTNGERRIQRVHKIIDPPDGIVPDSEQIFRVSAMLGYEMKTRTADAIMAEIARLTPTMTGVSYEKLGANFGLQWPVPSKEHNGTSIMHTEKFPRGKAKFSPAEYLPPGEEPTADFPFTLVTGRLLHHYNCGAQTRHSKLVEFVNHDVVEIHAEDAAELNIKDGERVKLVSGRGDIELECAISDRVPPGTLFSTFHFPETNMNTLLSSSADSLSKCPEYKVLTVRLEKLPQKPAKAKRIEHKTRIIV
ncbi:MAG TPA: formate dehydrogenase subunit alpha [Planctomycetota bacterium]|nr:formate dehydrogenase subunit alpha [Planctomycetota bacterium]